MSEVIYLVSRGSYSDYGVYAAFTSMDAAEAAIAAHVGGDEHSPWEIEEMPLNPDVLSPGKPAWVVEMDYFSGDGAKATQLGLQQVIEGLEDDEVFDRFGPGTKTFFWCQCWAGDAEHAIKIANERRTQHKAMKGVEHE